MKPTLKAPGCRRSKAKYDELLPNCAFNFNLRRYNKVMRLAWQSRNERPFIEVATSESGNNANTPTITVVPESAWGDHTGLHGTWTVSMRQGLTHSSTFQLLNLSRFCH
jgi:hypothetical protein